VRYPEGVGESPQNRVQIFDHLFQIDRGVAPGYAPDLVFELLNLVTADAGVAALDGDAKWSRAFGV
jgi:hypothetical protein